ncbi:MAG: GtrA family protein [Vicinamibacterales bacterium]
MSPRLRAFMIVGVFGFVVQMGVLFLLASQWHVPYLIATALAVETAVLHNFVWHQRWTWADRSHEVERVASVTRLVRFNLGTGLTSIIGNVLGTAVGVELLHLPAVAANAAAVAATTVANFLIADRWVFRRAGIAAAIIVSLAPSMARRRAAGRQYRRRLDTPHCGGRGLATRTSG